ncbi:guanine nucleotide exchange factor MSS4-like isoform X1 [Saccoglossus kowalevskii]|uniref:Guanine nucleotide exchange factor MSS4-like isoform X1 n=1 Tax=Saccoglossus kowalevskii TaxID=10224 RepID=A0ABM0MK60_SACKO|nr:PREDICTED: guanine nucleotide exchange factor MSS4-like isoform X1 [Saccoglossus kowalevskii]XP_006820401.1 PREDICTED: guanine nucleotide exchange factor MSS4-like isoform X2 [Saccoglossus kowalevskii]
MAALDDISTQRRDPPDGEEDKSLQDLLNAEGKNIKSLVCQRCQCKVLRPNLGQHVQKELFLPHMKKKSEQQGAMDGETLKEFWVVDDMYTFENVGFTNTVNDIKYLICADCEVGPIGWHDLSKKKEFYIALDRVHHI